MNKWLKYYLPNFWESLLLVLIFFFVGAMLVGALLVLIPQSKEVLLSNMLLSYLLPIAPVLIYILLRGYTSHKNAQLYESLKEGEGVSAALKAPFIKLNAPVKREEGRKCSWFTLGIILFIGTLAIGMAIDPIMSEFELPDALKKIYEKMELSNIDNLLSVVFLAPLCEEFIFRGTIQRALCHRELPISAIFISAILFGVIHLNLVQGVGAFLIGLFIGYAYYKTHSLWVAVFLHFVNNGTSYLTVSLMPKEMSLMNMKEILADYPNTYILLVVSGVILTILSVWLLYKLLPKKNSFKSI